MNIGYKILRNHKICKLQILGENNESRSGINCFKYQEHCCSKALVLDIWDVYDNKKYSSGESCYDQTFEYNVGKIVEPTKPYMKNMFEGYHSGIHYFKTLEAAIGYFLPGYNFNPSQLSQFDGKICYELSHNCKWRINTYENNKITSSNLEMYINDKLITKITISETELKQYLLDLKLN